MKSKQSINQDPSLPILSILIETLLVIQDFPSKKESITLLPRKRLRKPGLSELTTLTLEHKLKAKLPENSLLPLRLRRTPSLLPPLQRPLLKLLLPKLPPPLLMLQLLPPLM